MPFLEHFYMTIYKLSAILKKDDFSNAVSMNLTPLTQCYPFLEKHFVKKRNQIFLEHQYLATSRSKFPLELIDIGGRH